jgi:hypothetical protein
VVEACLLLVVHVGAGLAALAARCSGQLDNGLWIIGAGERTRIDSTVL